ncbi:unnamed protein product [Blepharisma stoltei]|uniref:3-oxo-5-alpha-steroid 4-dehydrogenase C-terminal domain-containing protein n=1 Tax=Blepharisma stoltei TaxID=1481888 RepID=A0AAU9IER8_9CILI|nr:unnamed protein product [Blepharisma stoltei]
MTKEKILPTIGFIVAAYIWTNVAYRKGKILEIEYFSMWIGYMLKRSIDALFIHIRSNQQDTNLFMFFMEWTYLWSFSSNISNEIYTPEFIRPDNWIIILGILIFSVGLICNTYVHLQLRSFKKANNGVKLIPTGFLFEYVSCPHYFFELLTWLGFYIASQTMYSLMFLMTALLITTTWGKSKHMNYIKQFNGEKDKPKYPNRKIIIPFIY